MKNKNFSIPLIFSLKTFLLLFFLILIILTLGYRYYEWKMIKNLHQMYVDSRSSELEMISESDEIQQKYLNDIESYFSTEELSDEAKISTDEFLSIVKIFKGRNELYINLIKNHDINFDEFQKRFRFLIGKRRQFEKNLLNNLDEYYKLEIQSAESNKASNDLLIDSYTLAKDEQILTDFATQYLVSPDQTEIANNFVEIVSIAKYTKGNFHFDNEELLMTYRPKGLDSLKKRAEYLSSNYEVLSEFSKGNTNSVAYKLQAMTQKKNDLNIDTEAVNKESEKTDQQRSESIAENIVNEVSLIQEANQQKAFRFPFLEDVENWYLDQTICNLVAYKFGIYSQIKNQKLSYSSIKEVYDSLKEIPPSFTPIEDRVNLVLIGYEDNDDFTRFTCPGIRQATTYQFTHNKF